MLLFLLKKRGLISLLLLYISNSFMAWADDEAAQNFATPPTLLTAEINNTQDVQRLLDSPDFLKQLHHLAQQLAANDIARQSLFSQCALFSMRAEHQKLRTLIEHSKNPLQFYHYQLYNQTQQALALGNASDRPPFAQQLAAQLFSEFAVMSDESLFKTQAALGWSVPQAKEYLVNVYKKYQGQGQLNLEQTIDILSNTQLYLVLADVIPVTTRILASENQQRYLIQEEYIIHAPNGVELAATIVRSKKQTQARPAALQFTIYADVTAHITTAIHAAAHGYVGIVVNSRGKRGSTNTIVPYEHDGEDANAAIEWISHQPWNDGRVAMYGGSYNGFTQWAAAKYLHPALKTMVPYAAANPITGLPYENNIVLTANYEWAFYVTNNKTVDDSVYSDWQHANNRTQTLYTSGRPIVDIDKIDGKANPWFQRWMSHPSYDPYYQAMLPYQHDYAKINIPILTITGYFDGGQISAIDFLQRHYQYNPNARHSLLIGPYNHFTAQGIPRSHQGNYQLDNVALEKDTEELTFAWFDHVLFNQALPAILASRVNYQLMGSNTWQHADSYAQLQHQATPYYLTMQTNKNGQFGLSTQQEPIRKSVSQTVDMRDRSEQRNQNHWSVIEPQLDEPNGLIFSSAELNQPMQFAGNLSGYFSIAVNKKDVDIGFNLYELRADGSAFHLIHYLSRASYANDMSQRELLTANQKTKIPITNNRMSAKLLEKGSRLVLVLNVNKNADSQVNLGSGKDVNHETLADAGEPLTLTWYNDSEIKIPISPWPNTEGQK